jgi:hypothetical protein
VVSAAESPVPATWTGSPYPAPHTARRCSRISRRPSSAEFRLDGRAEPGARRARGDAAAVGADQDDLQRPRQGPTAAERLTLAHHGRQRLQHLAAPGSRQTAQPRQVARHAQRLAGLAGTGDVSGRAQFTADVGDGPCGGLVQPLGVARGGEHGLLPARVADAGRIAGTGVQQIEGVRHEGGDDGRLLARGHRRPRGRRGPLGQRRCVEGSDDGRDAASAGRGAGDRLTHVRLARQIHRGNPARRLGVAAQRPTDPQGCPAYGLGGAARGEDLDTAVPHVVAVAARAGGGERGRERRGRLGRRYASVPGYGTPARVGHRQVAADDLGAALACPADGGEFGREVGEGVEAEPVALAGPGQGDRGEGARRAEMGQPGLEVGGQLHADDVGAGGVQQGGDGGGERRAVVPYAQQVRHHGVGEGGEGRPRFLNEGHRRFSRRSHRRRQVAEPSSARRRTGPSQ